MLHPLSTGPLAMPTRRSLLQSLAATASGALLPLAHAADSRCASRFGPPSDFSAPWLVEQARRLAARPWRPPPAPDPQTVQRLDYEALGRIRYRPACALFADRRRAPPVTLFHLGRFFPTPVRIHRVEHGQARELLYDPALFNIPADSPARELPADAGYAGFRLQEDRSHSEWRAQDWAAFAGASYFRAIGELGQYGLSARGIAVDVAASQAEEFPHFTHFWLEPDAAAAGHLCVHALLDGPSLTGAYRFVLQRDAGVRMEVSARLFLRRDIERLGIAPMSSMMWFAEHNRERFIDWRPEVHDSDGLELWTGAGERIWRPLNNPPQVTTSSFADRSPRGFGFMQRDRDFEHYLDGVRYERRPSLWIEPLQDWGSGAVQLVEIPTDDEIHDNVTAFWVSDAPARAGESLHYRYRLHWLADHPHPHPLARCVATRIGRGGEPGQPRPEGVQKFVVEFAGETLAATDAAPTGAIAARVGASRGDVTRSYAEPVPGTGRWRAVFDLAAAGTEPVELRLFLADAQDSPLSETWLYQHRPQRPPA